MWSRRYDLAIFSTSRLIVAEKSSVLRFSGRLSNISLMLSEKPMLSISSASSSTTLPTPPSLATPRFLRSMRRPGVATMTWAPWRRARTWFSIDVPP